VIAQLSVLTTSDVRPGASKAGIMDLLKGVFIECPYCGETIEVLIDCSLPSQEYIEDCEVCCRPITLIVTSADSEMVQVEARQEDE